MATTPRASGADAPRAAVTGVSGDVGLGTLRALRAGVEDVMLLGLDAAEDCAGYAIADAWTRLPLVRDDDYIPALCAALAEHRIQVLFPGIDSETSLLARHRSQIESATGCRVVLAPEPLILAASDKLRTAQFLAGLDLPAPATWDADALLASGDPLPPLPLIAKPRHGQGSRGIRLLQDEAALADFVAEHPADYCLQAYIDGPEVTIGILTSPDGRLIDHMAMQRWLQDGRTVRGVVVHDPRIDRLVAEFVDRAPTAFAVNLQARIDAVRGPVVFEINARLSGSTSMRTAVGFNDPARILRHLTLGEPMPQAAVTPATVHRILTEVVVPSNPAPLASASASDDRLVALLAEAEHLVFDCGDTLVSLSPTREALVQRTAAHWGVDLDLESIRLAYALVDQTHRMHSSEIDGPDARAAYYLRYNTALATALGIESQAAALDAALQVLIPRESRWTARPGAVSAIESAARHRPVHVLANWDRRLGRVLSDTGFAPFLTSAHSSEELGAEKPDPAAFAQFLARTGVEASRALYIGNDYAADVVGSRRAGFTPILYDPAGRAGSALDCISVRDWDEFRVALERAVHPA